MSDTTEGPEDEVINEAIRKLIDDETRTFWLIVGQRNDVCKTQVYPWSDKIGDATIEPPYTSFLSELVEEVHRDTGRDHQEILRMVLFRLRVDGHLEDGQ